MAIAVVLSSASTTIHWFLLFSYFLSLFMSQSCLADDQYFKLHRGRLVSRKLCPSCKLYPFFRDSPAWIPVLASVSAAAVFALLCSFRWHMSRRNQQVSCPDLSLFPLNLIRKVTKYFSIEKKIGNQLAVVDTQDLPLFPLDVICKATQNFSIENKLAEGGFGPVYKGILDDGKEIAVKRLSITSRQGIKEFQNEVTLLSKLQHENVVRLMGCCTERNELILIFEYMPNKSLHDVLFDSTRRVLEWNTRIQIINGIAQGILYLHEALQLKIIHRDLKLRNVLLDDAMNPKISDFGMAIIIDADQFEATTDRIVGTLAYMAPEYAMRGQYSVKTDVYSFGVLLLEIISGRKNNSFSKYGKQLLDYMWVLWCEGQAVELMDPLLVKSCDLIELMRCIHIGLLCVQQDPINRPTMSSIVVMLTSDEINLPQPNSPAFDPRSPVRSTDTKDISISINELTLSIEFPR